MNPTQQTTRVWVGAVLSLLFAIVFAWTPVRDSDAWYHLATGRLIADTHAIPKFDTWTYTAAGNRWITHEWLYELALYHLYILGGFYAMVAFRVCIVGGALWALDQTAALKGARPALRYPLLFAAAACAAARFSDRPQIVTFLGAALTMLLLERAAVATTDASAGEKRPPRIWPLIPLAWIWANCHAGVIYLLAIGGVYWMDLVLRRWRGGTSWRDLIGLKDRAVRRLTLTLAGAIAAILLTPNHVHTLLYGFQTTRLLGDASFITLELLPAKFRGAPDEVFAFAILIAAVLLVRVRPLRETVLPIALSYWALRWMRERATYLLILLPCYAAWIEAGWLRLATLTSPARRRALTIGAGVMIAATVFLCVRHAGLPSDRRLVDDPMMPAKLAAFHRAHGLPPRVFNPHAWGSYLTWASAGSLKVFIDARLDVFSPDILSGYLATLRGDRTMLEKFDVTCCLLDYDESYPPNLNASPTLRDHLFTSPDWDLVHWNDEGMIYVRRDVRAAQFPQIPALRVMNPNVRSWSTYVGAGRLEQAESELLAVIAATPDSLRPRRFLGHLYLAAGRWGQAEDALCDVAQRTGDQNDVQACLFANAKKRAEGEGL